jgi:hypothetical protein
MVRLGYNFQICIIVHLQILFSTVLGRRQRKGKGWQAWPLCVFERQTLLFSRGVTQGGKNNKDVRCGNEYVTE